MARNDGVHRTTVRNVNLITAKAQNAQHHNERQKESYTNQDIVPERTALNVHYKAPSGDYAEMFRQMEENKIISTRGLKPDAHHFGELIFDVNSAYFHNHGGYDYAKDFYAEAYKAAIEIVGGEQYILSAVMHADERNSAMSEALGQDVYHYHLHVVYIPVVEKQVLWTKRCKDPSLVGTVKETIMQVSASKKWISRPAVDEAGKPVLRKNGKPVLKKSYSVLQDDFYEHMKAAGYTDVQRGERGSTEEHLTVTQFKIQQEQSHLAELEAQIDTTENGLQDLQQQADRLQAKAERTEEKYRSMVGNMKSAEAFADKYLGDPDEWLPQPKTLESAKSYRAQLIPMLQGIRKLVRNVYTKYREAKQQIEALSAKVRQLSQQVNHLSGKLKESESEVSNYRLLQKILGPDRVSSMLSEVREREHSPHKNTRKQSNHEL